MKKYFFILFAAITLVACNDDDDYSLDKQWLDMATVENPNNSSYFFLRSDNNGLLWMGATDLYGYQPKTGQRVIANFTLLNDKPEGSNYDHDIKLNDAYNVLTKGIFDITPATQDSIGNDPVGLSELWIRNDFLNMRFYYPGYNKIHYISLVRDASKSYEDGKIHLEFRHNAHSDEKRYTYSGIVSFNLTSLKTLTTEKSLELVIHVKNLDGIESTHELQYKFDEDTGTYILNDEIFDKGKEIKVE